MSCHGSESGQPGNRRTAAHEKGEVSHECALDRISGENCSAPDAAELAARIAGSSIAAARYAKVFTGSNSDNVVPDVDATDEVGCNANGDGHGGLVGWRVD